VGVFGFSQGAYVAAQISPGLPSVRALVLASSPATLPSQTRDEFCGPRWLLGLPALLARWTGGWRPSVPEPEAAIAAFAPRPLLLVSGTADRAVPAEHARRLFAAAGGEKELWLVPGADHGGYARAAPADFPRRVVEFFQRRLGAQGLGSGQKRRDGG